MSSNLELQRICQFCGNGFIARTTTTKFCSHRCSSLAYKSKTRMAKVEQSNKETLRVKQQPIDDLKEKEFLTVSQVSKLINCSRQNVYNLINSGKLNATNILQRKTIVRRQDIDRLFKQPTKKLTPDTVPETQKQELNEWVQAGAFNISDCYTLSEVQSKYGISEKALYDLINRNNIPKIKKGWFAYVPKSMIDKLLN